MSPRRHIFCGIPICLFLLALSSLKVEHASAIVHAEAIEKIHPHAGVLELLSLSLDKWGSKASLSQTHQPVVPNLKSVSSSDLAAATGFRSRKSDSNVSRSGHHILLAGLLFWVCVAICFLVSPWGNAPESSRDTEESPAETSHPPSSGSLKLESSDHGSFACRYRESTGEEKEALTLLLRCNIISKDEFTNNQVSREHVDECVWIAKQMLEQRPLEEWVSLSQNGRQSFEDTVAAIYEARENARTHASAMDPPETHVPRVQQVVHEWGYSRMQQPLSSASLNGMKPASSVSLGSSVSFGHEDQQHIPSALSAPMPKASPSLAKKSPVPILNCYEQADVDQMSFTSSQDEVSSPEEIEEGFPSVFSSSSGFHDLSHRSTPAESHTSPGSRSPASRLRLAPQEIMAPAIALQPGLHGVPRSPQNSAGPLAYSSVPRTPQNSAGPSAFGMPLAYSAARPPPGVRDY